MAQAPSTVAESPLQDSLARIMGQDPLSTSTGTSSLISYDDTSAGFRNPQADAISIISSPGTGATTAETWGHEVALENLKRDQLEFDYQQQQNEISNALRQAENLRAIESAKREQEQHTLGLDYTRAQMSSLQNQQRLQQEQAGREAAEFIQKTGHVPSYYTSGQAMTDTRTSTVRQGAAQDAGTGPNRAAYLVEQGYLKPSEVGTYNQTYNMQLAANTPPTVGWQQGTGRRY